MKNTKKYVYNKTQRSNDAEKDKKKTGKHTKERRDTHKSI